VLKNRAQEYLRPLFLQALEKQNALELDYTIEAENLEIVANNMARHGFAPHEVLVPLPLKELTTRRMLVMDLLPGPKLIDGLRKYGAIVAANEGKTLEEFEDEIRQKIEEEGIPAKYDGPTAGEISAYLAYMRYKDAAVNTGLAVSSEMFTNAVI
jgi:hypothetical protein